MCRHLALRPSKREDSLLAAGGHRLCAGQGVTGGAAFRVTAIDTERRFDADAGPGQTRRPIAGTGPKG